MNSVEEVVERALAVLAERPCALVTDVDGTLSRIVSRPEDARVSEVVRSALRRIVPCVDLAAVVTGRESDVARRMVGVECLTYVGSYALSEANLLEEASEAIDEAKAKVEPYLGRLPGVTLETKDVSFALHYRNSPDQVAMRLRLLALLEPIATASSAKLLEGKLVVEVAPMALPDKGTAYTLLMRDESIRGSLFVGDDIADTTIFREIRHRRTQGLPGLAIGVVDTETPAAVIETTDVQLPGVDGVEAFLTALAENLEKHQP